MFSNKNLLLITVCFVLVPVFFFQQCSKEDEDGEPVELDELCEVFLNDACLIMIDCYGWGYKDIDHCRADQECLGIEMLRAEVEAGYVSYDGAAVGRCHNWLQDNLCDYGSFFFWSVPDVYEAIFACEMMDQGAGIVGQRSLGDSCVSFADCWPEGDCVLRDECDGTCEAWAKEGERCRDNEDDEYPRCDPEAELRCSDGTCRQVPGLGDPCGEPNTIFINGECLDGFWCNEESEECEVEAAQGEECNERDGPECGEDLWCDGDDEDGICRAMSKSGEACLEDRNCIDPLVCLPVSDDPEHFGECGNPAGKGERCHSNRDCQQGLGCSESICVDLPSYGEECISNECSEGHVCENDICIYAAYPGDDCNDSDRMCIISLCVDGECQSRAALGGDCVEKGDCASRTCENNNCVDPLDCLL